MKRLFVVGCSFTKYHWPTWADMLGKEYDQFENWGNSGYGNRAIAERLSELVVSRNITADDTIIVQWSDYHRFDVHSTKLFPLSGWNGGGNVLLNPEYSEQWRNHWWKEDSYMMHTFNFINLATALLETLPCTWYMLSMTDLKSPIDQFSHLSKYKKVFVKDKWLPPIKDFFLNGHGYSKLELKNEEYFNNHNKVIDYTDPHPTPIAHFDYLNTYLAPKLGVTPNAEWAQTAQSLLKKATFHWQLRNIFEAELGWDSDGSWVRGL